jgi:hypothetical protein
VRIIWVWLSLVERRLREAENGGSNPSTQTYFPALTRRKPTHRYRAHLENPWTRAERSLRSIWEGKHVEG